MSGSSQPNRSQPGNSQPGNSQPGNSQSNNLEPDSTKLSPFEPETASQSASQSSGQLPVVFFGALLHTSASLTLMGPAAIAAETRTTETLAQNTPQIAQPAAPQLVIEPDGSVAPAAQTTAQTTAQQSAPAPRARWQLVIAEDGTLKIERVPSATETPQAESEGMEDTETGTETAETPIEPGAESTDLEGTDLPGETGCFASYCS